MALRLTQSTLEPDAAPPTRSAWQIGEQQAFGLLARAEVALREGDTKTYVELLREAGQIEHDTPRYRAEKQLIECALAAAGEVDSQQQAAAIILAAADGALSILERNPAEPLLLSHAGVLLYELWCLEAARSLFEAAKRLDPEIPHLARNLQSVHRRRRAQHGRKTLVHPALRDLIRRAERIVKLARPAQGMKISLCMIMRDEEEMLERTLAAIAPVVDEMVIVDTGSKDRSIEIARSFGAKIIEREWTGDFSAARNVSLDAATGDWIIYLDADEVLVSADAERLRELAGHTWREAMFFHEINFTGREEHGVSVTHSALRMIRNRPEYRFKGRLHEQIAHTLPANLPERISQTGVRIEHYGYLGAVRDAKDKSRRNLELLLKQKAEGNTSAFMYYNLGSEHALLGEIEESLVEFEEAWRIIEAEGDVAHEFVPSLVSRTVKSLRAAGRPEEAIERAEHGLARFPGFTDLVYEQGVASLDAGQDDAAVAYLEKAISMGDAPSRYTALVGAGTFLPRIILAARKMRAREPEAAVSLMRWCVEHTPQYFGIYHPYATAMLKAGHPPEEIIAEIERSSGKVTPTIRFMLATALYEQGAAAAAETQFRLVLDAQPRSAAARAALVEALLYQRRYSEAAEEATTIDEDSGLAVRVLRSELFARLLVKDAGGASSALQRGARLGLPDAEQALYRTWLGRVDGSDGAGPIPRGAGQLLELMLESLLRIQDFESFETVHGLFAVTEMSERERRERLAQMYFRRGFLRSAAREWMAVCKQRPDVAALAGLTRVSMAQGEYDTAEQFADAARALAPNDEAVAEALKFITNRSNIQNV